MTLAHHILFCLQRSERVSDLSQYTNSMSDDELVVPQDEGFFQEIIDSYRTQTGQTIIEGKHDRIIIGDKPVEFKKPAEWIGEELREMRADANIKMRDLATTLGIEPTTLSDAENGLLPLKETLDYYHRTKVHING